MYGSIIMHTRTKVHVCVSGADPEILHGRWLMGWLPIVNYTGTMGVAD